MSTQQLQAEPAESSIRQILDSFFSLYPDDELREIAIRVLDALLRSWLWRGF